MKTMTQRERNNWIAKSGILAAVAIVLMYLEFPIPLMPGFLKLDISEVPVLLAAFALGPISAVCIELIKNIAHLPFSQTQYVGELANFIVGSVFVVTAGLIYKKNKNKHTAIISMIAGTLLMTLVASLMNYFVMIPFYIMVMGFTMEAITGMSHTAGNTLVNDLKTLIVFVFVPFNLLKGFVVSLIVGLIYKPLSRFLHRSY